jgi:hypothetical protein
MHRVSVFLSFVAFCLVAMPVAAAPTDRNSEDQFIVIPVDFSFTIPAGEACDFAIEQELVGFVKIHLTENAGNQVAEIDSVHIKLTWTNPLNGKTSDVTIAETDRIILNEDGSATVIITGLSGRDTIPGAGRVTGDIGRLILTFTPEDVPPTVEFIAGPHSNGPFPALCDYLA